MYPRLQVSSLFIVLLPQITIGSVDLNLCDKESFIGHSYEQTIYFVLRTVLVQVAEGIRALLSLLGDSRDPTLRGDVSILLARADLVGLHRNESSYIYNCLDDGRTVNGSVTVDSSGATAPAASTRLSPQHQTESSTPSHIHSSAPANNGYAICSASCGSTSSCSSEGGYPLGIPWPPVYEVDVLMEEERPAVSGVPVRAASVPALAKLLVRAFEPDGTVVAAASALPRVALLMHRWWCSSATLAGLLSALYQNAAGHVPQCPTASCQHLALHTGAAPGLSAESSCAGGHNSSHHHHHSRPGSPRPGSPLPGSPHHQHSSRPSSPLPLPLSVAGGGGSSPGDPQPTCLVAAFRLRVCQVFRYWITHFPQHLDSERGLSLAIRDFVGALPPTVSALLLADLSTAPAGEWARFPSIGTRMPSSPPVPLQPIAQNSSAVSNQPGVSSAAVRVSLVFNHMEPQQLAEHITFLEHKIIRRITFYDLKRYAESGSLHESAHLERSVALFNGLTQWVQCMVLSRTTPQERAEVIEKFINVAKKLEELRNFNSLMAVVGSLSHSSLARLSRTMACLSQDSARTLADLTELLSSASNFSNYRRALHSCSGFKIPILGIHLKDTIALNAALPDYVAGDLINVRKMAQLSLIFQEVDDLTRASPPLHADMDVVNTIRLSLDVQYTEDDIYELSLAREPRNSSSPQSSPTQSVLFAEWAAGPFSPPDTATIEKHVNAMVEAVFKHYDNDRDGYISREEFDAINGNFPFIASFCVLDADHDGMISREEMKKYFVHANCHALKNLKSGFKHDFHETTYFKPTFCAHCAGLLWGLIRQGFKCRDCGINAHKHCKDLVVMECKPKQGHHQQSEFSNASPSNAVISRRRFRRKKKSSVSESESSPPSPKYSTSNASCISLMDREEDEVHFPTGGSLPASPQPMAMWGPRRKISDSLLVPSPHCLGRSLRAQNSCPETPGTTCTPVSPVGSQLLPALSAHASHTFMAHAAACKQGLLTSASLHSPPTSLLLHQPATAVAAAVAQISPASKLCVCHTEVIDAVHHQLAQSEEARQRLQRENAALNQELELAYRQLHSLRDHVGEVRNHTAAFILRQMDTLHMQKDTHV